MLKVTLKFYLKKKKRKEKLARGEVLKESVCPWILVWSWKKTVDWRSRVWKPQQWICPPDHNQSGLCGSEQQYRSSRQADCASRRGRKKCVSERKMRPCCALKSNWVNITHESLRQALCQEHIYITILMKFVHQNNFLKMKQIVCEQDFKIYFYFKSEFLKRLLKSSVFNQTFGVNLCISLGFCFVFCFLLTDKIFKILLLLDPDFLRTLVCCTDQ